MNKIDAITRRLASQEPELKDADALCDSIMDHLPPQQEPQRYRLLHVLQAVASMAAILLLVLFVRQTRDITPPREDPDYRQSLERLQPERPQLDPTIPLQETLRQLVRTKSEQITLSQLKKNYTL